MARKKFEFSETTRCYERKGKSLPWLQNASLFFMLCCVQAEVDLWDPLTDTVPVHAWIHPWLPLMGEVIIMNCVKCSDPSRK